jgi:uncharacterized protein (DUF1501 family)
MNRRDMLKLIGSMPFVACTENLAFARPVSRKYDNLLVLVELKGGNDGLNTVVPFADPQYYALRPRIGIARDSILQVSETTGFHPSLQPLMPLWQQGELAVVQGVGYPQPNLSHFRSIEIWDTASRSDQYLGDGWLSRVFAASPVPSDFAADGVVIGSADMGPLSGTGSRPIALADTSQFLREADLAGDGAVPNASGALAHILKVENDIQQAAEHLNGHYVFQTDFPRTQFGNAVKTAAQVVASGSGVAVVRITLNGFDTHSNQPGTQARLLRELAEGLVSLRGAFREIGRWDRTLVMTYAEFGRRVGENGSNGTDHGTANTHFVLGGRTKGGLYGKTPQLSQLEGGNLVYGVDFRSLYATVLEEWWGMPSVNALGGRFHPLDVLRT